MNSKGQSKHRLINRVMRSSIGIICSTIATLSSTLLMINTTHADPVRPSEVTQDQVSEVKPATALQAKSDQTLSKRDQILEKVQKFYAEASDFKADFKQTYTYKIYGRKKVSTGKVYFKKPAKMRWDYEMPTQRVFVADGKTLWVYEPEEAQVFKRALSSAQLPIALRFMRGDAQLDQEFNIKDLTPIKEEGVIKLKLSPKSPSPDFETLELSVDPLNGQVRSSALVDPTGNINRIDFVAVKVNQALPNNGFSFTPPEGVRIIDEENSP